MISVRVCAVRDYPKYYSKTFACFAYSLPEAVFNFIDACMYVCVCSSTCLFECVCVRLWQILPQCLPQVGRLRAHALSVACNEIVFALAKCTLGLSVCVCAPECACVCVSLCVSLYVSLSVIVGLSTGACIYLFEFHFVAAICL